MRIELQTPIDPSRWERYAWVGATLTGVDRWEGAYQPKRRLLTLTTTPPAERIDLPPEVKDWAPAQVAGKLQWRMELTAELGPEGTPCAVVLIGRWYPGQVRWSEESGRPLAELVGEGTPFSIAFTRTGEALGKDSQDLRALIDARREEYERVLAIRDQLLEQLYEAHTGLDQAALRISNVANTSEALEATLDKIKTFEDILGWLTLVHGLGKGASKSVHDSMVAKLLASDKFRKAVERTGLLKSPKGLLDMERFLLATGQGVPAWLRDKVRAVDLARWQAVDDALKDMGTSFDAILKGKAEGWGITGSARDVAEAWPEIQAGKLRMEEIKKWKGGGSDLDFQVWTPGEKQRFLKTVQEKLKQRLQSMKLSEPVDPADLKINAFDVNLYEKLRELDSAAKLREWLARLTDRSYLGQRDFFRTPGGQKLAHLWSLSDKSRQYLEDVVTLSRLDGADLIYEMAHRAEMTFRKATYLDASAFKDIFKSYERALFGQEILRGAHTRLNAAGAKQALGNVGRGKALYKEIKEIAAALKEAPGAAGAVPAMSKADALARQMLDELRKMRTNAVKAPRTNVIPRDGASAYAWNILEAEAGSGKAHSHLYDLLQRLNKPGGELQEGLRGARRQWADELRLPEWMAVAIGADRMSLFAAAGVWEILGNPMSTAAAYIGFNAASALGADIQSFSDEELASSLRSLDGAAARLYEAERIWHTLESAYDNLQTPQGIADQLELMVKDAKTDTRCFQMLLKIPLQEIEEEHALLKDFVTRVRSLRDNVTRDKMILMLEATGERQKLYAEIQRAERELRDARSELEKELKVYRHLLGEMRPLDADRQRMQVEKAIARVSQAEREYQHAESIYHRAMQLHDLLPASLTFSDLAQTILDVTSPVRMASSSDERRQAWAERGLRIRGAARAMMNLTEGITGVGSWAEARK